MNNSHKYNVPNLYNNIDDKDKTLSNNIKYDDNSIFQLLFLHYSGNQSLIRNITVIVQRIYGILLFFSHYGNDNTFIAPIDFPIGFTHGFSVIG